MPVSADRAGGRERRPGQRRGHGRPDSPTAEPLGTRRRHAGVLREPTAGSRRRPPEDDDFRVGRMDESLRNGARVVVRGIL